MATDTEFDEKYVSSDHVNGKPVTDLILCYLVCPTDASGAFHGAILLTDNRARPEHFAYVQPVKPSKLQKILYGSSLEEHIKVDVIAQKLWQGMSKKPDVLFVDAIDLIAARRVSRVPTAFIAKVPDSERKSGSLSVVKYDTGPNVDDQSVVGEIIVGLETACDLVEPFARCRSALDEVRKTGG